MFLGKVHKRISPNSSSDILTLIHFSFTTPSKVNFENENLLHPWAKGHPPATLPAAAGFPVGANGFKSFMLQIHYDNPEAEGISNVQDSSGIRIFFAKKLRQHDAAILKLADYLAHLRDTGTSLGTGLTKHVFDCPSTCSQNHFEADEVTVFLVWYAYLLLQYSNQGLETDK